jgi:emp24/gp25L/p24 family/GOLD
VKWWSIFQLAVLIVEGIFQVWWLKRFFEVRYFSPKEEIYEMSIADFIIVLQVKRVV